MSVREITDQCDADHCEHDSGMYHERGAGVFCAECAAKRVHYSFDAAQEQENQQRIRDEQMAKVRQDMPSLAELCDAPDPRDEERDMDLDD